MVDEQTFVATVLENERMLYRVSRSILRNDNDCLDAVQEALSRAWARRNQVHPDHLRPWLIRIVINECHNIQRKSRRMVPTEEIEAYAGVYDPPDTFLRDALDSLEERLRLPLLLHYLEDFKISEIAAMLRIPHGTVKWRLHKARKQLRIEFDEEVSGDEPHGS